MTDGQVIDFAAARASSAGKQARILALLRALGVGRSPAGGLAYIDASGTAKPADDANFIRHVGAELFRRHRETASPPTIRSALAAYAGSELPTIELVAEEERGDILVRLATDRAEAFHDVRLEAYLFVREARETFALRSRDCRLWLERLWLDEFGTLPKKGDRADALDQLEGIARHRGPQLAVHLRVAEHDGRFYLDVANKDRDIVEIDGTGWRIVPETPVRFLRPNGMLALPVPVSGGTVDEARNYFNVSTDDDWVLVVSWLMSALRPAKTYPILVLVAEQGSAKSTATRFLRALTDPNDSPIRSPPRNQRDLAVAARLSHVIALDNLSGVSVVQSDMLCRAATGGGFATRRLYSDGEEFVVDFVRPIILNGIDEVTTRPDLAERSLCIELPHIPKGRRRGEQDLHRGFAAAAPRILGALLTGVSGAMARVAEVRLTDPPRMYDFAVFATAAERAVGWSDGAVMSAYARMTATQHANAIEGDPLVEALRAILTHQGGSWSGSASLLLQSLAAHVPQSASRARTWPTAANALSGRLRRLAPLLRASGVDVTFDLDARPRVLHLTLSATP